MDRFALRNWREEIEDEVTLLKVPIAKLKEPFVISLADLFQAESPED